MNAWLFVLAMIFAVWVCAYRRYSALGWTAVLGVGFGVIIAEANLPQSWLIAIWVVFAVGALSLNPSPLRRVL